MNGYTPTIPQEIRISNLLNQVPQEYRARATRECYGENDHEFERMLTGYVIMRVWETYEHPVNEANRIDDMLSGDPDRIKKHITHDKLHPKPYSSFPRHYSKPLTAEELENMAGGDLI